MKKILIAPNSYKGTINSIEAANIIEEAFRDFSSLFAIQKMPLSDGGDDFLSVLEYCFNCERFYFDAFDAYINPIKSFLLLEKNLNIAFIESAEIIGLKRLASKKLYPLKSSSYGLGIAIKEAAKLKVDKIIIGLGGTATIDAGIGVLSSLGAHFFDDDDKELSPLAENLTLIRRVDLSNLDDAFLKLKIVVCCDVFAPIFGKNGAIYLYGPQKGADEKTMMTLELGFRNYFNLLGDKISDKNYLANSGAAGGIPASLKIFTNVTILSGTEFIFELLKFQEKIYKFDIIIVGEGKLDNQTLQGKAPYAAGLLAKNNNKISAILTGKNELPKNSIVPFDYIIEMSSIESNQIKSPQKMLYLATKKLIESLIKDEKIY